MYNKKTFSLVLPAFNEELNIKKNIEAFENLELFDEIIVVDNNSKDNTKNEIKKTKALYFHETIQGYGSALRKGMELCKSDYIVLCEPDSTFSAKDIYKFLAYIEDFECIFGTRTTKSLIQKGAKMQFYLRIGNILVAKYLEYIFLGPTLSDVGCTYKVLSKTAYEKIKNDLKVTGSEFQPELMIKLIQKKIRILEIPVNYYKRVGNSKITYNFFASLKLAIRMIYLITSLRLLTIFK